MVAFTALIAITVLCGLVTVQSQRISQTKCIEYSKLAEKITRFTSLSLESTAQDLKQEQCDVTAGLIVDGVKAKSGEFPHMAAIGFHDLNGEVGFICGGSLISDRFVLTAAHCIRRDQFKATFVRLGSLKQKPTERHSPAKDYEIDSLIVHEQYNPQTKQNDIALIRLRETVDLSSPQRIRPACLWQSDRIDQSFAIATGWGATEYNGGTSNELLKVKLDLLDNDVCQVVMESFLISENQLCAGLTGRHDTCQGDSGGPLQVASGNNKCVSFIIGVTAFGEQCGVSTSPSIYTRVSSYLDWIEVKVWE